MTTSSPFHPQPGRVSAELRLAALATAAGCARRLVDAQLVHWRLPELTDTAGLVTSELVTNAICASGTDTAPQSYASLYDMDLATVVMRLRLAPTDLLIEVWDRNPNPPVLTQAGDLDESGRGLTIVAAVAREWGYYPSPAAGGKVVWAEIAAATASRTT